MPKHCNFFCRFILIYSNGRTENRKDFKAVNILDLSIEIIVEYILLLILYTKSFFQCSPFLRLWSGFEGVMTNFTVQKGYISAALLSLDTHLGHKLQQVMKH